MPWVGFEPMIPAFERAKTVHALDREATVVGMSDPQFPNYKSERARRSCVWRWRPQSLRNTIFYPPKYTALHPRRFLTFTAHSEICILREDEFTVNRCNLYWITEPTSGIEIITLKIIFKTLQSVCTWKWGNIFQLSSTYCGRNDWASWTPRFALVGYFTTLYEV
jgi:hypothetical protein